ncbi:MAG: hypothetical protein PHS59_17080 [Paludibacter sp.]|nr:hypothetical protein [Paludibacter sp.]
MSKNLLEIDRAFTLHYRGLIDIQRSINKKLKSYPFDLSKNEITDAVIERMYAFWHFNVTNNKEILHREINTTAADFFTETCLLFFKAYFEKYENVDVCSEKTIGHKTIVRPDISIWHKKELLAVIELKVSNGWKGKSMLPHLSEREEQIKKIAPNAYFGVLAFWNFFDTTDKDWNSKYFGLVNYDKNNNHLRTNSSIENIIFKINQNISNQNHTLIFF